jgi:hypothetical protein
VASGCARNHGNNSGQDVKIGTIEYYQCYKPITTY